MLVKPNVGRISVMNSKSVKVLIIIDRLRDDRVQCSSASAVQATSTGNKAARRRSNNDGRSSIFGQHLFDFVIKISNGFNRCELTD